MSFERLSALGSGTPGVGERNASRLNVAKRLRARRGVGVVRSEK